MALPPGIVPKTVTIGIASFFDGSIASGRVTISAPVNVIHTPTNRPIFSSDMTQSFVDGAATFNLCPTDAPGLNRVDWTYKLKVEISGATVQPDPIYFTLPAAGPDTVDLDSLVTVPSSAGIPISATIVTSVNGQTGDVTVSGGSGSSVVDASATAKGVVQLAGDLSGTAGAPTVPGLASKAPLASPAFTGTPTGITKAHVGLGNVDNTADIAKPVSTAQQSAIDTASTANRARANHTGTQAASTITGLATVATSGAYADLSGKPSIPTQYTDAQAVAANATVPQTQQTGTAYTLALTDVGTVVETTNSATTTITVPLNSATAFPIGSTISLRQYGAGQVTIAGTSGVTLRSRGSALKLAGQYAEASVTKRATDEWVVSGDLTT